MIKVPIVLVTQGVRQVLLRQTLTTLEQHTHAPHKLLVRTVPTGFLDHVAAKNAQMDAVLFDWEYGVFVDDDVWFGDGWLGEMVRLMEKNPDVWVLAGTTWPSHKVLNRRPGLLVMETAPGPCFMVRREAWERFKPFTLQRCWDGEFCQRVRAAGGQVAVLAKQTHVVHCGITTFDGRHRSPKNELWMRELAERVGAVVE